MEAAALEGYGSPPEFGEFEEPPADGSALVDREEPIAERPVSTDK